MSFISSVTQLSDHNPIGQAAEQLPAEKLQEYRDIFLYFDRWQKHYCWNFWQVTKKLLLKLLTGDKKLPFKHFDSDKNITYIVFKDFVKK